MIKLDQIDQILNQQEYQKQKIQNNQLSLKIKCHLIRSIMIVIDMTKSMQIKDLKPSRLNLAIHQVKNYIKKVKDITPIVNFSLAIVQQELCKLLIDFTYQENQLMEKLDILKIQENSGFFSLENTLRTAMDTFQKIPLYAKREMLLIQSSPSSKDYRNIYDTIDTFSQTGIHINIISFVGITHIFNKLAIKCGGRYQTVASVEDLKQLIDKISYPMPFEQDKIKNSLIKVAWCRKQYVDVPVECFCHLKPKKDYFVCGFCYSILCKQPPIECIICGTLLLIPVDIYRHINTTPKE